MMYSDIEHWVFLLKKTSGVCDLIMWENMVIVFQNKLFSQKKKSLIVFNTPWTQMLQLLSG